MPLHLFIHNAVVVARHFNPTITDQIWLAENRIVLRDEPEGEYVFTEALVQVQTPSFHLLIVPDKCQFTPLGDDRDGQQQLLVERIGRLIQTLPHTPYRAAGLNFVWHYSPEDVSVGELCRRLFFTENLPLDAEFNTPDAHFGAFYSKDTLNCRMKLEAKPVVLEIQTDEEPRREPILQFSFNFHLDVMDANNPIESIIGLLEKWEEAHIESERIIRVALGDQIT